MSNTTIKVGVADDHALFRKGMLAILRLFPVVETVGEAHDGISVMQLVAAQQPDVLLLDLVMPNSTGFDTIRQLRARHPQTRIIVVSMYDTDLHVAQAIEAGACGYLSKNADPDEIIAAIESVHHNGFYFNENTGLPMLQNMYQQKKLTPVFVGAQVQLNANERAVIKGMCAEMTSAEIAAQLHLGVRTVEKIRANLMEKLGVKNAIGVVLFGIRNGIHLL